MGPTHVQRHRVKFQANLQQSVKYIATLYFKYVTVHYVCNYIRWINMNMGYTYKFSGPLSDVALLDVLRGHTINN